MLLYSENEYFYHYMLSEQYSACIYASMCTRMYVCAHLGAHKYVYAHTCVNVHVRCIPYYVNVTCKYDII